MTPTSSRILQYLGLFLVLGMMGGGYWYFRSEASTAKRASNTGLVGYWSFDEGTGTKAGDASGQGNTGTLTNGPTWVDGKLGKAVNFDGSEDYVQTGSGILPVNANFTVSAWGKGGAAGNALFSQGYDGANDWGLNFRKDTCDIIISNTLYRVLVTAPDTTNWHHYVCMRSGNVWSVYIDGVFQNSTTQAGSLRSTGTNYIGGRKSTVSQTDSYWSGAIDEVRIYNRALTAPEITNLYNLGAAKLNTSQTQSGSITSGLVGVWSFNGPDISGTTAYDRSGSGNNGTLTNGPTVTPGISGQALRFDGSDDYVSATNVGNVKTISYWIKTNNQANGGIELNSNQFITDNVIPEGFDDYIVYIDGVAQPSWYGSELLTNGDMEANSTWLTNRYNPGAAFQNGDAEYRGSYAWYVATDAGSPYGGVHQPVTVTAGQQYKLTGWFYHNLGQSGVLGAAVNDSSYIFVVGTETVGFQYRYGYGTPANTINPDVALRTANASTGSANYFDQVSFKAVTTRYPLTDTSNWHHVVITTSVAVNASAVKIGKAYTSHLSGFLDEVRMYNRALSASEIESLYRLGQPDKVNTSATSPGGSGRLDSGLAGYWPMDGGFLDPPSDVSTNGNHGSFYCGGGECLTPWTTGQIGGAIDLNGTSQYLTVSDNAIHDFDDTVNFTLSAWFNRDTFTTDDTIIAKSNGQAASDTGYNVYIDDTTDKITFVANDGTDQYKIESVSTFTATGWNHFALSWNDSSSSETKLYINGVAESVTTTGTFSSVNSLANTLAFLLGAESDGGNLFDGKLDELRVYRRALSADEVSLLYKTTAPTNPDTGLKGYWSFNGPDLSGTTAYDRSGSSNNGTLTNSPTVSPGKLGQGLSFDGASQYISLPNNFNYAAPGSVSAWIKTSSDTCGTIFATSEGSTANNGFNIYVGDACTGSLTNEIVTLYRASGGVTTYIMGYTTATRSELIGSGWHHLVVTADGASLKVYIDGVSKTITVGSGSNNGTFTNVSGVDTTVLGSRKVSGSFGAYFNGQLDEVRIYNRALTAPEIAALYNQGR